MFYRSALFIWIIIWLIVYARLYFNWFMRMSLVTDGHVLWKPSTRTSAQKDPAVCSLSRCPFEEIMYLIYLNLWVSFLKHTEKKKAQKEGRKRIGNNINEDEVLERRKTERNPQRWSNNTMHYVVEWKLKIHNKGTRKKIKRLKC